MSRFLLWTVLLLPGLLVGEVRVFRCLGQGVEEVASTSQLGQELPSALVVPAGRYSFQGRSYDVGGGLVRFCDIPNKNEQRLVWDGDPLHLLSGLAWLHVHGLAEDGIPFRSRLVEYCRRCVSNTCGNISHCAVYLLEQVGIRARVVSLLTIEPLNNYDNGHTLIEVFWEGSWQLVDIDLGHRFLVGGRPISGVDFVAWGHSASYVLERLNGGPRIDLRADLERYDHSLWFQSVFSSEELMRKWYDRCCGVFMIHDDGKWWFTSKEASSVNRYASHYSYLPWPLFFARFYAGK